MSAFKILASVMLIYVNSFAVIANPSAIKHPISQQIQTYLNSIDFEKYIENNTKFNISFLVTTQNEIVVISTDNVQVDEAIKEALNYKKIAMKELEYNKVYTVPVNFK